MISQGPDSAELGINRRFFAMSVLKLFRLTDKCRVPINNYAKEAGLVGKTRRRICFYFDVVPGLPSECGARQ